MSEEGHGHPLSGPSIYDELVRFYPLLDPLEDHEEEAMHFASVLKSAAPHAKTLLELGSGAGHGAYYVKRAFEQTTLTDVSSAMLGRSKELNSDCEHIEGDMRSLRLDQEFDLIMIHDAICHLETLDGLRQTAATVQEHLAQGGAALIVPDCTKESFYDSHEDFSGDDEARSMRAISWSYDPDPSDSSHLTDFAFLLREHGEVISVHERHRYGLFPSATWQQLWTDAGFVVQRVARPLPPEYEDSPYTGEMFLCTK